MELDFLYSAFHNSIKSKYARIIQIDILRNFAGPFIQGLFTQLLCTVPFLISQLECFGPTLYVYIRVAIERKR